ncbi:MAG: peptidylprolyl isomerase [Thermoleophilia bacterium]
MRPLRIAALAALVAAMLATGACGGGSSPTEGGGTTATAPPATTTVTGAEGCRTDPPEPPPDPGSYPSGPRRVIAPGRHYTATLDTSCGTIVIALDQAEAPRAVNSFVFLARRHFFDGLTFHRVVPGFIIQGGDPQGDGFGGPGYVFEDELPAGGGYPDGSVAMANAGPDTNGSQFFIVVGNGAALAVAYTRFGRVTRGLDVARRIASLAKPGADPTDTASQVPVQPVYIYRVTISGS